MADERREVVVTDVKIPFWSMVVLMVKWAIAAIPALIILLVSWRPASFAVQGTGRAQLRQAAGEREPTDRP